MRLAYLLLPFVALAAGCAPDTSASPPPGWTRIDATYFSFSAPPDLKTVPVRGIDSYVGKYESDALSLSFDYGSYSDPLDHDSSPGFTTHGERIGGKSARVVSHGGPADARGFTLATGVHFPRADGKSLRLTLYAHCRAEADCETARTIFRTIRFP